MAALSIKKQTTKTIDMGTVDFEFDYDGFMIELGFENIGIVIIEPEMDFDTKICEFIIKIFLIITILAF